MMVDTLTTEQLPFQPLTNSGSVVPVEQEPQPQASIAGYEKIKALANSQPSLVLPTIVAVLAAAKGQFGPAMQLYEHKRQTETAKQVYPIVGDINTLVNTGKFQEAGDLAAQLGTAVGPKSPEIAQLLKGIYDNIRTKQQAWADMKTLYESYKPVINENDPRYKYLQSLGAAVKNQSPASEALVLQLARQLQPHIQNMDNKTLLTDVAGGATKVTPLVTTFDITRLPEMTRKKLSADLSMTEDMIDNIMKGIPVQDTNGVNLSTPQNRDIIGKHIAALQGQQYEMGVESHLPKSPEFVVALRSVPGMTPERIARGNFTPDETDRATAIQQERAKELAEAPILAAANKDFTKAKGAGLTAIDVNPESPFLGRELGARTHNEVLADKNAGYVRTELLDSKITPALRAIDGLNYVRRMYEEMSTQGIDGSHTYGRISRGLQRTIENYVGIPLSQDAPIAKAMEAIANRSIEQVEKTQTVDDRTIGQLKSMITGRFADPVAAEQAVRELQGRLKSELNYYIGRNKVGEEQLPSSLRVASIADPAYRGWEQAIIANEGTPDGRRSPRGAVSKYQIIEETALPYLKKIDPKLTFADMKDNNIARQVFMLHSADLAKLYPGRPDLAAAAYFSGEPNVDPVNGVKDWTKSDGNLTVKEYVDRFMANLKKQQAAATLAPVVTPTQQPTQSVVQKKPGLIPGTGR